MSTELLFRNVREIIASNQQDRLSELKFPKPLRFNWVKEIFERINLKDLPNNKALIWTNGTLTSTFSFEACSVQCNKLLNFLRAQGLLQMDVIYAQMPLLPEQWFITLASIKGGFQLIPAATILTVQDIVYRFGKLMPKAVIADTEAAEKIDEAEILGGKSVLIKIIVGAERTGWLPFSAIAAEPGFADAADTAAEDPLFLFFTSGTTGMPKVVTHTHASYPIGHLTTAAWIGVKAGDVHYNISQPGWAKFAWSSFFAPWNMGATVFAFHQLNRFSASQQLSLMALHRVTCFCAPPTALRMLILENLKAYTLSLRECVAAGEPLNPEIIEAWKNGTGLLLRDGYGQTESTLSIANFPGKPIRYGSMGKPAFMYDIVIANEDGQALPDNEEGYITIKTGTEKTNGLFSEYFGDPGKKKEVFKNGLYYTGDKAYKDPEGYIWFVGRDDDVIKSSDYRVGPFEVESVLLEHESVIESAVVGSPHPVRGYLVKAFIVLHADYKPNEANALEIFAFAKKNLAAYKTPRILEFVKELPKTISGKIRRVELRTFEAEHKLKNEKKDMEFYF